MELHTSFNGVEASHVRLFIYDVPWIVMVGNMRL